MGAALYGIAHAAPFFASAVFDAIAFVSALVLKLPRRELAEHSVDRTGRGFLRDMADGWRWVAESRMVVTVVALMMLVTSGTGAMAGSLLEPLGFRGLALLFDSFVVAAALICWTSARVRNLPKTGSWDTVTL